MFYNNISHMDYIFSGGIAGVTCLLMSVRLAHASLQQKLNIRKAQPVSNQDTTEKPNHTKKSYSDAVKENKSEV